MGAVPEAWKPAWERRKQGDDAMEDRQETDRTESRIGVFSKAVGAVRMVARIAWGILSAANIRVSSFVEKQVRRLGCEAMWLPPLSRWVLPACMGAVLLIVAVSRGPVSLWAAPPHPTTSFDDALANGRLDEVRSRLYWGHDVNTRGTTGYTPLITAAIQNDADLVKVLLANGAEVDAFSIEGIGGYTALHMAVHKQNTTIIEMLLRHGANIDAVHKRLDLRDDLSVTPLQLAIIGGNIDLVEFLLQHGANVNGKNLAGDTPLHMALVLQKTEIADLLRKHGGM